MSGPLAGIRVIDLSSVVMGPYATQMLGDLGADVIQVESPEGDTTRQAGHARTPGMGAVFLTLGRNKRSVVPDLKHDAARAAFLRLLGGADVLLHNMRPHAARRLGLANDQLAADHPRLVHCVAAGFGSDGPYAGRPAHDDMIEGASGTTAILGRPTGEPRYVPMVYADKVTGLMVANAILAALLHRERGGGGQCVEVPMFESVVAFNLVEHLYDAAFDRPDLAADPLFRDIPSRLRHMDALYAAVAEVLTRHDTATCLRLLADADTPAQAVNTLDALFDDPQLRATGFFVRRDHPTEGRLRQPSIPLRFGATPAAIRRPAPRLGEHTEEVLREAGLSDAEIAALRE